VRLGKESKKRREVKGVEDKRQSRVHWYLPSTTPAPPVIWAVQDTDSRQDWLGRWS